MNVSEDRFVRHDEVLHAKVEEAVRNLAFSYGLTNIDDDELFESVNALKEKFYSELSILGVHVTLDK